jgi:hypothetical protein
MSYYNNEQKKEIYKRWIESGRPWFSLVDKSKEPTYAERQIIIEMKKRENTKANHDKELEKKSAEIREKYKVRYLIPYSIEFKN